MKSLGTATTIHINENCKCGCYRFNVIVDCEAFAWLELYQKQRLPLNSSRLVMRSGGSEQLMRKRQRKKLSRNRCLLCRSDDGVVQHYKLKTGRWTKRFVFCWNCDPKFKAFKLEKGYA